MEKRYFLALAILMVIPGALATLPAMPVATGLLEVPHWVAEPSTLPLGLEGTNNCTRFAIGNTTAQWDFHSDGACWERQGPDGWTRQQQHRVHVESSSTSCGGGPADVFVIRVCREGGAGQPTPFCAFHQQTGPLGCAICVPGVVCH
jgi:hypothetical protein